MQKNVAGQKIGAQLVSATDGSAFTGSVTVYVTGDAGTQAVGSVGSGACAHEGEGYHTYAPAQAETNYDLIAFTFKGTGAVPVTVQVYTRVDANVLTAAGTAWNSGAITEGTFSTTAGSFAPLGIIDQGTAQSATSTTLVLRAGASFGDDDVNNCVLMVKGSDQGYWQAGRIVTDYVSSTDTATIDPAWEVTPTGTITYILFAAPADLTTPPAVNVTQLGGSATPVTNMTTVYSTDFANNYNTTADRWRADATHFGGTAGTFNAGIPDARLAAGVTHGGSSTGLTLPAGLAVGGSLNNGEINATSVVMTGSVTVGGNLIVTSSLAAGSNSIPWNASWDAEVQSECADALAAYDPPTKAELDSAESNIRGADSDTLKTLSDQIDGLSTSAAPQLLLNTTIATLASQTSFTLTAGSPDDDAYNGAVVVVTDQSTSTQKAVGLISGYAGGTRTVTLSADPAVFTMAVGDTVDVLANITSAPTVTQIRQEIDSNSTQLAAIVADTGELQTDWANGGRLDVILDARASQTSVDAVAADLPQRVTKNTALAGFPFKLVSSSDHVTAVTGATVTATRSLDGAAFAACANSASEVASGWYKIDLAAGDLNGNTVALRFTASGADAREFVIVTQPT